MSCNASLYHILSLYQDLSPLFFYRSAFLLFLTPPPSPFACLILSPFSPSLLSSVILSSLQNLQNLSKIEFRKGNCPNLSIRFFIGFAGKETLRKILRGCTNWRATSSFIMTVKRKSFWVNQQIVFKFDLSRVCIFLLHFQTFKIPLLARYSRFENSTYRRADSLDYCTVTYLLTKTKLQMRWNAMLFLNQSDCFHGFCVYGGRREFAGRTQAILL